MVQCVYSTLSRDKLEYKHMILDENARKPCNSIWYFFLSARTNKSAFQSGDNHFYYNQFSVFGPALFLSSESEKGHSHATLAYTIQKDSSLRKQFISASNTVKSRAGDRLG